MAELRDILETEMLDMRDNKEGFCEDTKDMEVCNQVCA